jgi:hypothetical protein
LDILPVAAHKRRPIVAFIVMPPLPLLLADWKRLRLAPVAQTL